MGHRRVRWPNDESLSAAPPRHLLATEIAESGLNRPNARLTVKVEAVRDGHTSWQAQHITIPECRGYGLFYGATYGE